MGDRFKKTERILNIWLLLSNNPQGYKAKDLARRYDVNERTIYRDFLTLGEDLHVPVYNDGSRWKMDESRFLPPIRFTIAEAMNIFLSARLMLNYSHRYDPNIDATFTKLSSILPETLSDQVNKSMEWMQILPKDNHILAIMANAAEAWVSQKQLKITYHSLTTKDKTERIIEPYYIEPAAPGHASYIIGYCHLKESIRTFKIERIETAEVTDVSYTIPSDFNANEYLGSSWGIVVEGEVKTIKIKIQDKEIIRLMEETVWHPSQVLEKKKDGSAIMILNVTDTYELLTWILGWGEKMEVLEPLELRKAIIEAVKAMLSVYEAE